MKKIIDNDNFDIYEINVDKNDIMEIVLIENASVMNKESKNKYSNTSFLKITNRKGNIRVLDLQANIDITNFIDKLEISHNKKTKIKPIFIGQ